MFSAYNYTTLYAETKTLLHILIQTLCTKSFMEPTPLLCPFHMRRQLRNLLRGYWQRPSPASALPPSRNRTKRQNQAISNHTITQSNFLPIKFPKLLHCRSRLETREHSYPFRKNSVFQIRQQGVRHKSTIRLGIELQASKLSPEHKIYSLIYY